MTDKKYELKEVKVKLFLEEGTSLYSNETIDSPDAGIAVMKNLLSNLDREMAVIVNLDVHLRPINYNIVSMGDIRQTLIDPRNIFKSTILSNANGIIMFHNHPSGEVSPSVDDVKVTKRLLYGCNILGITMYDHVIVGAGNGKIYSFHDNQPDLFEDRRINQIINRIDRTIEDEMGM